MPWKTLDDMDLNGKVVLVRVDINVPMEAGRVTDMTRIDKIKPTVEDIIAKGGKPVLLAHFDRPKGKVVPEMSLGHVVDALAESLGRKVVFGSDCVGEVAAAAIAKAGPADVVLLENTRFHPGEEKNDPELAAQMAALGQVFVNDAFSAAHRAHASTEGLARLLPAAAGRLMAAELHALETALGSPERPVVAVVGGAKVSTKIELLANLVTKVDHLVIGGGMANTFLVAEGIEVGQSLAEREMAEMAREIRHRAQKAGCQIHLPVDEIFGRVERRWHNGTLTVFEPVDLRGMRKVTLGRFPIVGAGVALHDGVVEAALVRQVVRLGADIPLAGCVGAVAVILQQAGHGDDVAGQRALVARLAAMLPRHGLIQVADAIAVIVHAGQQHRARR